MNPNPTSCCLCINLRLATFVLAVGQTAAYGIQAYQIYTDPAFSDLLSNIILFSCTFLSFMGLYGVYGVFKKNAVFVRLFSRWFLYELVSSVLGVFFVTISLLSNRQALCLELVDKDLNIDDDICLSAEYPGNLVGFLGLFVLGVLIRLHYFFSIRSFARQLEADAHSAASFSTKVVYPQYVFVSADEKTSLA